MQALTSQAAPEDVHAFIQEYFDAWKGTDENKILAYFSNDVVLHLPTGTLEGKTAVHKGAFGKVEATGKKVLVPGCCRRVRVRSGALVGDRTSSRIPSSAGTAIRTAEKMAIAP